MTQTPQTTQGDKPIAIISEPKVQKRREHHDGRSDGAVGGHLLAA